MRRPTASGRRRMWSEFLYALLGLPIGVAAFTFTITALSVDATLLVTLIGLPLVAVTGWASRWIGSWMRVLANRMIGADVPPAQAFRGKPGLLGWIGSCLTDGTAWRAQLYFVLKLPIGLAGFMAAAVFYGYGLGGVTYALWRPFLPCDGRRDGQCHRAAQLGSHYLDTPVPIVVVSAAGVVLLLLAPWVVRGVLAVDQVLVRTLLGPSPKTARTTDVVRHHPAEPRRPAAVTASQGTWSPS